MKVYPTSTANTSATWQEPIETIWQAQPGQTDRTAGWKRTDLSLSDRLLIGAVMNLSRCQREWGIVQWLADFYETSRPTLYAIGARAKAGLLAPSPKKMTPVKDKPADEQQSREEIVVVTRNRMVRTITSLFFPGGVTERSMEVCLQAAFDQGRSASTASSLLHELGKEAGEILQRVDYSGLGEVMQARDELFVGRDPILLMVEPHSLTITGLYATSDRDAETWGCVLLFTQDRGVQILGLAEDNCIPYDASCKLAQLDVAIQKDVWHPLEDVHKVINDVEREALRLLGTSEKLQKQLRKHWDDDLFAKFVEVEEKMDDLMAQSQRLGFLRKCLWDAVELVDWRNGEIRDRWINQWWVNEVLKEMKLLPHERIQKLVERLANVIPEMLTFLDSIAQPLAKWQAHAEAYFQDHTLLACFQASVARLWRLTHALRNGQNHFRSRTLEAEQSLALWLETNPQLKELAEQLLSLLEKTVRTSSAAETINSVLRPYLDRRRECTDLVSRQLYLNLFALWFNMHPFERGPRKGKSPFQIAGIDLGTDDWLTLLGYPPD